MLRKKVTISSRLSVTLLCVIFFYENKNPELRNSSEKLGN